MAVPISPVKLVHSLCLRVETVYRQFTTTDALFCAVYLMSDVNSLFVRHPFQPFNSHLDRAFTFKIILCKASRVVTGGHILHQSPEIQRVCVIANDLFTRLTVENNTWPVGVVIFD